MFKKRLFYGVVSALAILSLAGCGSGSSKSSSKAAPAKGDAITIQKGEYIIPDNQDDLSTDKSYLALKIKVKNNGAKNTLSSSAFKLRDKSDDTIKPVSIYGTGNEFSTMELEKLSKGDTASGYIVFPVEKKTKYTLEVNPMSSGTGDIPKSEVKIDTGKYKDNTKSAQVAVENYVNSVLFNKTDSDDAYKKTVANDILEERKAYRTAARSFLETNAFNSTIVDTAANKMIDQIQSVNAKKGSASYEIKSATPTSATVDVTPTVLKLTSISTGISEMRSQIIRSGKVSANASYSEIDRAVKNLVISKFPEVLESMPVRETSTREVKLIKEKGKWKLDSTDYGFKSMQSDFAGKNY